MNRRMVLRGFGGAAIALPLLESLEGRAWAQGSGGPKRFIVFFEHGGTISNASKGSRRADGTTNRQGVDAWAPKSAPGQPLVLGPIHEPLEKFKDSLVCLRSINNMAALRQGPYGGGGHGFCNVSALTAANITDASSSKADHLSDSASIDFDLAQRLVKRNPVPFPLVNVYVPAHNYKTPFFSGPRQRNLGISDPVVAFDKYFGNIGGNSAATARARVLGKSVLDGVKDQLGLFRTRVSSTDRAVVDAHLEHVRGIEKQLEAIANAPISASCTVPPKPAKSSGGVDRYAPLQIDILIAALRCGLTNVATFELGDFYGSFLNPTFPAAYNIGHSIGHAARDTGKTGPSADRAAQWYDTMLKNRQWRMQQLARLLEGLASTPEGNGTMLDNSLVMATSEFSDASQHSPVDQPFLLAGKAGGRLKTGRFLDYNVKAAANPATLEYETRASSHNLFTSIVNMFGFNDRHYGSSNHAYVEGPLPELA